MNQLVKQLGYDHYLYDMENQFHHEFIRLNYGDQSYSFKWIINLNTGKIYFK